MKNQIIALLLKLFMLPLGIIWIFSVFIFMSLSCLFWIILGKNAFYTTSNFYIELPIKYQKLMKKYE